MLKAQLLLTGSLEVLSEVVALLSENGYEDAFDNGPAPHAVVPTQGGIMPAASPQPVITPAIAAAGAAAGVELDATGLPWDERIHSSSKSKKAGGIWTKRKNLAAGVYEAVEAELRAQYPNVPNAGAASAPMAQPVVAAIPVAEPIPMPVATPVMAPQPEPVMQQPVPMAAAPVPPAQPLPVAAPVMAPQPTPVAAPVQQPAGPPSTLHELMTALTPLMDPAQGGRVTSEYLIQCLNELNTAYAPHLNGAVIGNLVDIAGFPTLPLAGYVWQLFQRDGHVPA